jgi:NAD(P)-dependent dehydrogenase (short-subunit alcohol dehydrogenase family)
MCSSTMLRVNQTLVPVLLVSLQAAVNTMNINFIGTFLLSREATKIMMKNNFGRIVNFGSMAIRHEEKGEAIYTASKAAIVTFTKILWRKKFTRMALPVMLFLLRRSILSFCKA